MIAKRRGGESRTTRCIYSLAAGAVHGMLTRASTSYLQRSLDSEPHDASAATLVITRGWPWQRTTKGDIWIGGCS